MTTTTSLLATADAVAREVIASNAAAVDDNGTFPEASLDALRQAGLFGILSATEVGGQGQGIGVAAQVVERAARECGSTAMTLMMHYCGTAVIEAQDGPESVRRDIAAGKHLTTLAFSERGSRSHFWAPISTAKRSGDSIVLDAHKSWVTSAHEADSYVWSSKPVGDDGMSTIWLVPRATAGLDQVGKYTGLGLRGNDSTPVVAQGVEIPANHQLGPDGGGFDIMMGVVLPLFNLCNAATSVGIMDGALSRSTTHVSGTNYEHLDSTLADLPTIRAYLAKARIQADATRALWMDAIAAVEGGREDTMLRVLQVKAAANEAAVDVTQTCMRVCGGAAYRADVGVERYFRDARAGFVMAPTSDQLYDFIGKAITGLPLF